ncbi:MAG TPA: polysaccharide biosynthesis/export family protein [Longimicrobiaceae bacterium]|nr:polysaccharide biosynthesis/export family protein [Longimicrobiaceae bacterium]
MTALLWLGTASVGLAQSDSAPAPVDTAASASEQALIRPGDQVVVQIWREPDLEGSFTVDERGEVVLPRLGRVHASTMTATALQDSLYHALGEYLRNPSISVSVLRRIGVHGAVRKPDLYMMDLTTSVQDAITKAGGITEAGNPNEILLIRGGEKIKLGERERARMLTSELRSGDEIVVGHYSWFHENALAVVSSAMAVVSFAISISRLVN